MADKIEHSHLAGVNKTFVMVHPEAGEATVGDWQEAEFLEAGWSRKLGRPKAEKSADAPKA